MDKSFVVTICDMARYFLSVCLFGVCETFNIAMMCACCSGLSDNYLHCLQTDSHTADTRHGIPTRHIIRARRPIVVVHFVNAGRQAGHHNYTFLCLGLDQTKNNHWFTTNVAAVLCKWGKVITFYTCKTPFLQFGRKDTIIVFHKQFQFEMVTFAIKSLIIPLLRYKHTGCDNNK